MASLGLNGPYALDKWTIDQVVPAKIGAYALGHTSNGNFVVEYVGRSDDDVNCRLKQHIGFDQQFKFSNFSTMKEAFEKECRMWHDFPNTHNKVHPARPAGLNYTCPVCGA